MATNETVIATTGRSSVSVGELPLTKLVALALIPGALVTLAFVVLAPVVEAAGFPIIVALLAAIMLVMVPFELAVVLWAGRGTGSLLGGVPYREHTSPRTWIWLVPALILAAFVGFGLHQVIEPPLIKTFFGWLPQWYVTPISIDHVADFSRTVWIVTLSAFFAINGFIGPIVEELYFRGYLLPRMQRFGRWAPLLNVSLFSLYHFWSPWQLLARVLGFGATVYAVQAKRNVYLGMAVHCSLNAIAVTLVASMIFGRL